MRWVRRLAALGVAVFALAVGSASAAAASPSEGWHWPVAGHPRVEAGFAPPAEAWLSGHRGVDLLGRAGEPVRAAAAGVVHYAGRIAGVGVVSVLHPDGLLTTYEPVRPLVRVGETVRRGEPLGRLSHRGSHCAPATCLHWGLRRGTAYLDPLSLVGAGKVRLYPLHPMPGDLPAAPVVLAAGGVVLVGGLRPAQQLVRRNRRGP